MKTVLLLGGEGFVGQNLINELSEDYKCFSIGNRQSNLGADKSVFIKLNPYIEKVNIPCDVCIHLIDNNIGLEDFLIEEAKLFKNLNLPEGAHMLIFSSAVIYANPESDYAKRKLALEDFYKDLCVKKNLSFTVVRLFNPYGPQQLPYRQGSLIANIFMNHLAGKETVINDLEAERDFMYICDVAKFVRLIIEEKYTGMTDLGTGHLTSIGTFIKLIEEKVIASKLKLTLRGVCEENKCPPAQNKLLSKLSLTPDHLGLMSTFNFYKEICKKRET